MGTPAAPRVTASPGGPLLVPLGVLSAAALSVEVLLTKFLAYGVSAVLVSIVLGIALLGFGAAGTLISAYPGVARQGSRAERLAWASLGFSWSTLGVFAVLVRVSAGLREVDAGVFVVAALLTLPFLCAGFAVAVALEEGVVGRTYGANLLGSAIGCLLPLLFLRPLGGERMIPLLAGLGGVAAWMFARGALDPPSARSRRTRRAALVATAIAVGLAAAFAKPLYSPAPEPAPLGQLQVVRDYVAARGGEERLVYDRWNAVGRIQIFGYDKVRDQPSPYPFLFYVQDSSAGSSLARWERAGASSPGAADAWEDDGVVAHACREAVWAQAYFAPRKRVLVIGLGGGMDVQCALFNGATSVDVVEINPDSIAAVTGRFDAWTGHIGTDPRVRYHLEDGRSFIHRTRAAYDVIQLSGVDTKNASSSGSLALSENTLYTDEAFTDYLANLSDDGVLSIVRFSDPEAVRLSHTAVTALRREGRPNPERHLLVEDDTYVRGVIVKHSPLTAEEISAVERSFLPRHDARGVSIFFYEAMGMDFRSPRVLEYAPGRTFGAAPPLGPAAAYLKAVEAGTSSAFLAAYPFDAAPATDDRPFFFDVFRYSLANAFLYPHVRMLATVLLSVLVLGVLLLLLPLRLARFPVRDLPLAAVGVFTGIGLGYLFVEVWLIHRLSMYLGHQTYALGVVLFTLLVGTGLGARRGGGTRGATTATFARAVSAIVVALAGGHFLLPGLLEGTLAAPFAARALIAGVFAVGLGFVMGQPFPAGLAWARTRAPEALPWYLGINGFASVLATLAVVPLSHALGYEAVLASGGACYVLAAAASVTLRDPRVTP